jgi:hypothetical protein
LRTAVELLVCGNGLYHFVEAVKDCGEVRALPMRAPGHREIVFPSVFNIRTAVLAFDNVTQGNVVFEHLCDH